MPTPITLDYRSIVLPKGTRVVLRRDVESDGYVHRCASVAVVVDVENNSYRLETPSGRQLTVQRDQITVQKREVLDALGVRQWDFVRLEKHVIYSVVVGSQAWGLATEDSDEDVRGVFLAPFEDVSGLWTVPGEIHDPGHERAYWEIARFVTQGLKGDANTLETLWSPIHRVVTPLGQALVDQRQMFVSMNVLGSFGRYAQSQFKKIERTLARHRGQSVLLEAVEAGSVASASAAVQWLAKCQGGTTSQWTVELKAILRSLEDRGVLAAASFDAFAEAVAEGRAAALRPAPFRPKNAYNLLRLLYSCQSWLQTGAPLIRVAGTLRETLLAVKTQRQPIETTLEMAKAVAAEVEEAAPGAKLPEAPDYSQADAFLRRCRRAAARRLFIVDAVEAAAPAIDDEWTPRYLPTPLPDDIDRAALAAYLAEQTRRARQTERTPLWVGLTGAHSYGFASPDSDLDLKGVHVAPAVRVLSGASLTTHAHAGDWHGREMDYTTNELGAFAGRLLSGNGNALEQLLGPFVVVSSDAGHALVSWARTNLSSKSVHHYRGFLKGIRQQYAREAQAGTRKAKTLLYGYRVALTGLHLLRHGEIEMDVCRLGAGRPRVAELVIIKTRAERSALPPEADDAPYLEDLERFDHELATAAEQSMLPAEPKDQEGLARLLVALRP